MKSNKNVMFTTQNIILLDMLHNLLDVAFDPKAKEVEGTATVVADCEFISIRRVTSITSNTIK